MALSSDQINSIINGQNQSSGGWGAAAMPTMAMPQGVGSNAIPTGAIAGRTAQGLLDSRNAPNYIGGLLGKYNPGQDSSALQLANKQAYVAPPPAAPGEPGAVAPQKAADNVMLPYGPAYGDVWSDPTRVQTLITNGIRGGLAKKEWDYLLPLAGGWKPDASLQEYLAPADRF